MLPSAVGSSRPGRWILLAAAAIAVLAALSPRDLWAPDEPWYGRIADEMERGGDWLVPHFNGRFDAEKPPVVYWLVAAAGKASGGVGPVSARLACALLAAAAVLVTARLARTWFSDAATGDTAALLFATSGLVLWNSSRLALDLPMTLFVLLATWAGTVVVARRSLLAAIGCGAALGMGILVKGPHALYVPICAVAGGCIAAGVPRRLLDPRWLAAAAATAAVVLAWLVPALAFGEKAFGERLLGQLASRVGGENEPHAHAFPYLIGAVFLYGLPWTPAWIGGALLAFRRSRAPAEHRFGLGAALWGTLVPLLLLSIPTSKRELYLIPLLPCLGMLAAYAIHRFPGGHPARAAAFTAIVVLLGVGVGAAAAPFVAPRLVAGGPHDPVTGATLAKGTMPLALAAVAVVALASGFLAWRRRGDPPSAVRAAGTGLGAVFVTAALLVFPAFDVTKTFDAAVPLVRAEARGAPLVAVGFNDGALNWAFRPDVVERAARDPADTTRVLETLFAPGAPRVLAAVRLGGWEQAVKAVPALRDRTKTLWTRRVGPKVYVVVAPADEGR